MSLWSPCCREGHDRLRSKAPSYSRTSQIAGDAGREEAEAGSRLEAAEASLLELKRARDEASEWFNAWKAGPCCP